MLSASTARLVDGAAALGAAELVQIKGADESVPAQRLLGMGEQRGAVQRAESALVGRRWEMSAVQGLLQRAIDGHGAVIGVVGPPGIGKSRLVREVAALAGRHNAEVFAAFCESRRLRWWKPFCGRTLVRCQDPTRDAMERWAGRAQLDRVTPMVRRFGTAWILVQVAVLAIAACTPASRTNSTTTTAPQASQVALFYTKAGSLYVSDPAGTPGRKLTDGPADTQPAPSPDGAHVAYVHKANASDYGGELWVVDLLPERAPVGAPRRLVDPARLPPAFGNTPGQIVSPRWSPAGKQVAFLQNVSSGAVAGGLLRVAAADTGAVLPSPQQLFASEEYAWAPDGRHIAWTQARSDVSPVDVNVLEVGAASTPVTKDTNAFSVTYGNRGQTILFANGDASGEAFAGIPFAILEGGIYSVVTPGGAPANPAAPPTSLFTGKAPYGDVAALTSGAIAFTERSAAGSSKSIQVLDARSSLVRTKIANVAADSPGPVWGAGDVVAYLDISPGRPLVVTDVENRTPKQVDTGVDTFAWPP